MKEKYALRWLKLDGGFTGVELTPVKEDLWTKTYAVGLCRQILQNITDEKQRELALRTFTIERIA